MNKKFSDLGIIIDTSTFIGDKIAIKNIINKNILLKSYKISKSKFEDKICLTIQINVDNQDRIIFTSSKNLMIQIEKIKKEDFPVETKIEMLNNNGYIFT